MFCLGILTYNVVLQAFEHGYKYLCFVLVSNVHYAFVSFVVDGFFYYIFTLYCSVLLSMSNMEKHYRNKITSCKEL